MAELSTRYAKALYRLALQEGMLDNYLQQAALVRDALDTFDCQRMLTHPDILDAEKLAFLQVVFSGKLSAHLDSLMKLAVTKKRAAVIVPALTEFIALGDLHRGKTTATVVSASPIGEGQLAQLAAVLSKRLQKQVSIVTRTDPALIGGLYIHVDGYLIDRTVRKYLRDMKDFAKRGGIA